MGIAKRLSGSLDRMIDPLLRGDLILHPYMACAFPILFLKVQNIAWGEPAEIFWPIAIALVLAGVIWMISYWMSRSWQKSALITSGYITWFFSYALFRDLSGCISSSIRNNPFSDEQLMIPYMVFIIIFPILIVRLSQESVKRWTGLLNMAFLLLIVVDGASIIGHEYRVRAFVSQALSRPTSMQNPLPSVLSKRPDIYYIILDALGSSQNVKEYAGIDITPYTDWLKQHGFFIADESRCNYTSTLLSLSSSLNMDYLDQMCNPVPVHSKEFEPHMSLIRNSRVMQYLKERGYKAVLISSGVYATNHWPNADVNLGETAVSEFNQLLLDSTVLQAFEQRYGLIGNLLRDNRCYFFNHIDQIAAIPGPKFVMVHICLPHPPFLFNADGSPYPLAKTGWTNIWGRKEYGEQALFALRRTCEALDRLMKCRNSDGLVVIIQGDHGPPERLGNERLLDQKFIDTKTRIFNAYRLPVPFGQDFSSSLRPVNSFRAVFNSIFGCSIPLLANRAYLGDPSLPFDLQDISSWVPIMQDKSGAHLRGQ